MPINPDALLIFRAREGEEKPKPKKAAAKEPELSKMERLQSLGTFRPNRAAEPMIISPNKETVKFDLFRAQEEAKSKVQQVKEAVEEHAESQKQAVPQQPQAEQKPVETKPVQQPVQPQPKPQKPPGDWRDHVIRQEYAPESRIGSYQGESGTKNINLLGYRIFTKKPSQEEGPEKSIYAETPPINPMGSSESSINVFSNNEYISKKIKGRSRGQLSREAARGRKCAWHPWRESYAICNFCHRPFCFEDIIEYGKNYYCLEDIDAVSSTYKESVSSYGNNMGILAGSLMMLSFLTFFYFANNQVIYVFGYLHNAGVFFFLEHINYSYVAAIVGSLIMVLAFIAALQMFLQSKRRFFTGTLVCIAAVALFSFQYTTTGTLYLGIIDAMTFIAFFALLYSRATISMISGTEQASGPESAIQRGILRWPNVGRF